MKTGKKVLSLIVALATVAGTSLSTAAFAEGEPAGESANTVYVGEKASENPDGTLEKPYTNLQAAINAAHDGDTVQLLSGLVITETVTINRKITLDGTLPGGQRCDINVGDDISADPSATGGNHVFQITVPGVTIKGVNIFGSDKARSGIHVWHSGNVKIENVSVTHTAGAGIIVNQSKVTLSGAITLTDNAWGGINIDPQGKSDATKLTIDSEATLDIDDQPAIWVDLPDESYTDESAITAANALFEDNSGNDWTKTYDSEKNQVWYTEAEEEPEPSVGPVGGDEWAGPAGTPGDLTANTAQAFTFPFEVTGDAELSELQLDIYFGDNTGEDRNYSDAVKFNLPASANQTATSVEIQSWINSLASNSGEQQNAIKLLEAAGVTFSDETTDETTIESIGSLSDNVSYQYNKETKTGTWTITLDTTKFLNGEVNDFNIEFLAEVHTDTDGVSWGNNNYNAPEKGTTQAYLYTITKPETATLQSIAITKPATKTVYTVGDTLDISGLEVTGTYSDSSTKVETVTADNISGFDSSTPAESQTLTITVGGKTTTYTVVVKKKPSNNPGGPTTPTTPSTPATPDNSTTTTTQQNGATTVTVTTAPDAAPTVSGGTASFGVTVPAGAVQAAAGTAQKPAQIVIAAPTSTLINELKDPSVKTVQMNVTAPSEIAYATANNAQVRVGLDAAVLEAAKQAKKDVTLSVTDALTGLLAYSWTFQGGALAASGEAPKGVDLALNVKTSTMDPAVSRALPAAEKGALLTFADNGTLPATATVRVRLANQGFLPGQTAYLYYYNSAIGKLEALANSAYTVDQDGYASIVIDHTSQYVILKKQVPAVQPVRLDTGSRLTVKAGRTYQFKVTASAKPSFVCGNGSVFRIASAGSKGSDYFFKFTAVGKPGDSAGFYVNGEKSPRTIGTIAK